MPKLDDRYLLERTAIMDGVVCAGCGGSGQNAQGCLACCRDCGRPCSFERDGEAFHTEEGGVMRTPNWVRAAVLFAVLLLWLTGDHGAYFIAAYGAVLLVVIVAAEWGA